ncbi:MAG TPA: tetratricopeptide repeat protein [Deltaproteobacteria bacterium]|nr:tetratricopeptide repeat protein [Deltaproteobacteria bacterium]
MDVIEAAPALLAALFEDGGAELLARGGLGGSWPEALSCVPTSVLEVPDDPSAGLLQLLRLRDFWLRSGDLRPAIASTQALIQLRTRAGGPDHPDTLVELASLGALAERAGRGPEGSAMLEDALARLRPRVGDRDRRLAVVAAHAARSRVGRGELEGAEALLRIVLRIRRGAGDRVGAAAAQLGEVRLRLGQPGAARPLLAEAHREAIEIEGPRSELALARAQLLGRACAEAGDPAGAAEALRPVYAALTSAPERRAAVGLELGLALLGSGGAQEGIRLVEASVRWTRGARGPGGEPHPALADRLATLARLRLARGRADEAEGLLLEALDVEQQRSGDTGHRVALRYVALGRMCANSGRIDEALGWLEPASSLLMSSLGPGDDRTVSAVEAYVAGLLERARCASTGRDRALVAELVGQGLHLAEPVLGRDHPHTAALRALARGHRM